MSKIGFAAIVGAAVGMCVSAIVSAILTRGCEPCGYSDITGTTTTTTAATTTTVNAGPDDVAWFWNGDACERTDRDGVEGSVAGIGRVRTGLNGVRNDGGSDKVF